MQQMLFYIEKKTPRFLYISEILFRDIADFSLKTTTDKKYFSQAACFKINYSSKRLGQEDFFLESHSLLFDKGIHPQKIIFFDFKELPAFFKTNTSDFPFDFLAASFYLISRYEEYLTEKKDLHARFTASQSLAFQNNFLHLPLIQLWMKKFISSLQNNNPRLLFTPPVYSYLPTYDIDMAWSYKHKGFIRTLGGIIKDIKKGSISKVTSRLEVVFGLKKDPFDTFHFFEALSRTYNLKSIFFFLLGEHGAFDKNISSNHPKFIKLIQKIHQKHICGIHPSYKSNSMKTQLKKEKEKLTQITKNEITKSRQHFLKLSLPETYRNLLDIGIKEDYTMGYAQNIGFRASIGIPFFWYDLLKEETTDLKLFPFQVMDVTLKQYLKLSPEIALEKTTEIIEIIKKNGGIFCTLWHNSSFAESDGWEEEWKEVYIEIVKRASN